MGHDHQSRVAPARGGKAERIGLQHSGSHTWLALLCFFSGVASRPTVSYPDFLDHEGHEDGVFKIKLESGFSYHRGHRGHGEEKSPARF